MLIPQIKQKLTPISYLINYYHWQRIDVAFFRNDEQIRNIYQYIKWKISFLQSQKQRSLFDANAPIIVKPGDGEGGGGREWRGIGQGFDGSLWPGVRAFELSCCPGDTDIWIFVRACDHFPGVGKLYLTAHFCLGVRNFTAIFWKRSNSRPMPRLPPRRLGIDRCIISLSRSQNRGRRP